MHFTGNRLISLAGKQEDVASELRVLSSTIKQHWTGVHWTRSVSILLQLSLNITHNRFTHVLYSGMSETHFQQVIVLSSFAKVLIAANCACFNV